MTGMEAFEESSQPDPDLIRTTTDIIMSAEAKALKTTLSSMSDNEIASLLRCLEPIAHERLLGLISQGRQRRILMVIQQTDNVTSEIMLRDAQKKTKKLLCNLCVAKLIHILYSIVLIVSINLFQHTMKKKQTLILLNFISWWEKWWSNRIMILFYLNMN